MKKRLFSLLLSLAMLLTAMPANTVAAASASSNYATLASYIDAYGNADSDGYNYILDYTEDTDSNTTFYFIAKNTGGSIIFQLLSQCDDSVAVNYLATIEITQYGTTADVEFIMLLYYYGDTIDYFTDSQSIYRQSFYPNRPFSVSSDSEYFSASEISDLYTSVMNLLTTYWDAHLMSNLGFGLYGLGFTQFDDISEPTYTINGTVTGADSSATEITLTDNQGFSATTTASAVGRYSFKDVPAGTYYVTVTKPHHATVKDVLYVERNILADYTVNLLGDITGDNKINMKDWSMLYNHISETSTLSGYQLTCADVNLDGKVNMKDWTRVYNHITEVELLWKPSVTLKLWIPDDDYSSGWLESRLDAFEASYGSEYDIIWDIELCSEGDVATRMINDPENAADVFLYANDQIGTLVENGALAPLEGQYRDQVLRDNTTTMIQSVTYNDGKIYGLPATPNTWFMYYNKSHFSENDIKSLDTMLSKGRVAFDYGNGWYNGAFFFGAGGTLFGPAGNDADAGVDFGPLAGDVAKKMVQMYNTDNLVNHYFGTQLLADGDVGACFSGYWDYESLKAALGDNLGVAALPSFSVNGNTYRMKAFAGSKAMGVNAQITDPTKAKVATDLAAFLASEESQALRFELRSVTPAHIGLANSNAVRNNPVSAAEVEVFKNCAIAHPTVAAMTNYWAPMSTFGGEIACGEVTVYNAAEKIAQTQAQING